MPNDFLTLNYLCKELDSKLKNGKIEKIFQPEKDEITLNIRAWGNKYTLALSCNAESPRIHLTSHKKENPLTAPNFCMYLRKAIGNGKIESISMLNNDRIFEIKVLSKNEMMDIVQYRIIIELMGRYSNILLVKENGIIADAVKQVSFDSVTKRCIISGMKYSPPEMTKPFIADYDKLAELDGKQLDDLAGTLSKTFNGLAYISAKKIVKELEFQDKKCLNSSEITLLFNYLKSLVDCEAELKPCAKMLNNSAKDYFIFPYDNDEYKSFDSISECVEECVSRKDIDMRQRQHSKYLIDCVKKAINRLERKKIKAEEKLEECAGKEKHKISGDLIFSNLHKIKKGDKKLITENYYEEDMKLITIDLNIEISPSNNATAFYKKYNKLKKAEDITLNQIIEMDEQLLYLNSIDANMKNNYLLADLEDIEQELISINLMKKKSKDKRKFAKSEPYCYEIEDFVVYCGKNNIQNDKLTFKVANGGDVWIHTKNYHGSHTIIFTENREVPQSVLLKACEITAYYSKAREAEKVDCDYTFRKFVKRHCSGSLGMVNYTNFSTLFVNPCQHAEYLKK